MKTALISPDIESEKALSTISQHLLKSLKKQDIDITEETFTAGKFLTLFKKIPQIKKYDLVHLQHEYGLLNFFSIPYFFILPLLKKNLIITMHTIMEKNQKFKESKLKTFFRKQLYKRQNKCIDKNSKLIIVHENFAKEILINDYGIPKEKIKVIPQGVIEDVPTFDKEQVKKELNLSGPVYLMIGNLTYDNGSDIILKQAGKIRGTILLVTNPVAVNTRNNQVKDWVNLNKDIVKNNNFQEFVRFDIKHINSKMNLWWKYFSAADLILLPYRNGVRSGIFSDAMASKTPVISSNIKFFREYSEEYGVLDIPFKEDFASVIEIAMRKENYEKMCQECQRYFDDNNFTAIAKKHKEIYDSLGEQ